ncbi:DUF1627 domain-containing protein [Escherichia coli]|nr:DUF1627 domain-containing protein [Escherichia coli]
METVFDALKVMKRASSQEVAARLGISREDAVNELWELKRRGEADSQGSMWWLKNEVTEMTEETATVTKITEQELTAMIAQRGPQTADDMATLFGTTSRKVASTLAMAISKGRLIRINRNGKFYYTMPDGNDAAAEEVNADPAQDVAVQTDAPGVATDTTEQPLADEHPDNLVSTLLRRANRQLRLAKGSVVKHERVCAALRVLNANRDIVEKLL